jgi:hypothetical protein
MGSEGRDWDTEWTNRTKIKKGKAIPVTDVGEVVIFKHWLSFTS